MIKRLAIMAAVCLLIFILPVLALATESEEDFEDPTRPPDAPKYISPGEAGYAPEDLQDSQIVARSFYLMESSSGDVLRQREQDLQLFPASTTKIMTALIALEQCELDELVTITESAMNIPEDSSVVPFKVNEVVTMEDALYGMLLKSGNEAANAIAEHIAGNVPDFVTMMNETAIFLGCTNTNFMNPHGYHDELHQTTAHDLAIMMKAALNNETFRKIISTREWALSANPMNPSRRIQNSNLHINPENDYYYQYSLGGKTGFTSKAGYVLVEVAEKNGVELIAVAMYSGKYSRWPDISRLFEYGFTQYQSITPTELYNYHANEDSPEQIDNRMEVQLYGFDLNDTEGGRLKLKIESTGATNSFNYVGQKDFIDTLKMDLSSYTVVKWDRELRAPIEMGQVMGTITFFSSNDYEEPAVYNLIAERSVAVRLDAPPTLEEIEQRVLDDPSPFPPFDWDWFLPPVLGALAVILLLRLGIRALWRQRKKDRRVPTPKHRTMH